MKIRLSLLPLITFICGTAFAGNLTVNLTPTQAVSAGAQWRVDGGTWRNSGTTVKNLSNAAHTVDYKAVTGWTTPASSTVTLTNNVTTTVTGTYVQPAALTVTLTPSSGQWRVDGGVWRSSGTTATGLTAGAHTISYNALSNYNSPATETVTLPANQTTNISRSYIAVAALTVTLTPSNASWQVDGGSWQSSGATVTALTPGNHTIAYSTVAGMLPMASETVNLPGAQTTSLSRSYTAEARLTVNLTPSTGSWQLDSGVWRASGATATGVTPGTHTISYSGLSSMIAPPTESITLAAGENASISRSHTPAGYIFVMLNPTTAQWRVDGGAWRASHTSTGLIAEGPHFLEYSSVAGKVTPAAESVNVVAGQNLQVSKFYASEAFLIINLTPSVGQWRVDGGVWHASGERVEQLAATGHTIDYTSLDGYAALPSETVVLYAGQTTTLSRTYILPPARLTVNLSDPNGWWNVDNSGWRNSGQTVINLTPGSHTISYLDTAAAIAPASETITLQPDEAVTISREYTPAGKVYVTLSPSTAQWRVDGGTWRASSTYSGLLAAGTHTLDYSAVATKVTLPTETINIVAGQNLTVSRGYQTESFLTITLTPAGGQWRVDGGAWRSSGETVGQLTGGGHTVDYASVAGYVTPATETVNLATGQTTTLARTYTIALTVNLSDPNGRWQAGTSGWRNSGQTINLAPGNHAISYLDTVAAIAPPSETITLQGGGPVTISRDYTPAGKVLVTLDPGTAQWRLDGGMWRASATDSGLIAAGPHLLEYSSAAERITPAAETVNVAAGQTLQVSKVYAVEASLTINLTPSSGQWRINGGGWHNSGERVAQLTAGAYTVDYTSVDGYSVLPAESVVLASGETKTLSRTYTLLPARLTVNLSDPNGQWRADNSAWHNSGETIDLTPGSYTISYLDTAAGIAPASETVTLQAGALTISRNYTPAGKVSVTLDPGTAQWRVDGGTWRASATDSGLIAEGPHLLEYSSVAERITPAAETINVVTGQTLQVSKVYAVEASLTINLTPSSGQWRINGGGWHNSGERVAQLTAGAYTVDYTSVDGYSVLPAETVLLDTGETKTLARTYTLLPARLTVNLSEPDGRWRADTFVWHNSGETINLAPGSHTIFYWDTATAIAPRSETLTLQPNQEITISRDYAPAGRVRAILDPTIAQWRVDGGFWRTSATYSELLLPGGAHSRVSASCGESNAAV